MAEISQGSLMKCHRGEGGEEGGGLTMGWSGNSPGGLGSHSQLLPVRNPGS